MFSLICFNKKCLVYCVLKQMVPPALGDISTAKHQPAIRRSLLPVYVLLYQHFLLFCILHFLMNLPKKGYISYATKIAGNNFSVLKPTRLEMDQISRIDSISNTLRSYAANEY